MTTNGGSATWAFRKEFWDERLRPLKAVRDDADVAHYRLDLEPVKRIDSTYAEAASLCRTIIDRYAESIAAS